MLGQEVAVLRNGYAEAGVRNRVVFDAQNIASGMYFVRLQYGSQQQIRKMLLMK